MAVRVGLAQLNLRLGDLDGNAEMIMAAYDEAVAGGAQVVVFSELTVTGYPPEDLLLKPAFVEGAARALERIAQHTGPVPAVVGFPEDTGLDGPIRLWNSAAMCSGGHVRGVYRKHLLPNYSVFDEQRYFVPGTEAGPLLQIGGVQVGVSVCEDLWGPPRTADATTLDGDLGDGLGGDDDTSPVLTQVAMGAQLVVVVNGSPYRRGKQADREAVARTRASALGVPVVYVNQVGGQDELVFDGSSFVTDADGNVVCRLPAFVEQVAVCDVAVTASEDDSAAASRGSTRAGPAGDGAAHSVLTPMLEPLEEVWQALVVATRDYVRK
ncbi:MAG: NAD+ synthase, partial [Acidimicrobiaceae bacterium]|nr:NAD+ synthase [Acidimicrobiaceae bacterium]